jgi:hypothetical protein
MAGQMYEVTIVAEGEVRDAEGNLVSPVTASTTMVCTADEVRALTGEDPES